MSAPSRDAGPVVAVDIGGTNIRVALVRGASVLRHAEFPTNAGNGPHDLARRVSDHILARRFPEAPLGVSCTGRVREGRVTAVNQRTMPGWDGFPLAEVLSKTAGRQTFVLGDAKAATLAEWRYGAGSGTQNFVFVTISTGIGSGLILNGRLHSSPQASDVGLGFTLTGGASEPEWLEHVASGTALGRRAAQLGLPDVRALFDAAERDDGVAREVVDEALYPVAYKLADLHVNLGLEKVALGGSVGLRRYTLESIEKALCHIGPLYQVPLVHARLGPRAGLVGAACWAGASQAAY